MRRPDGGIAAAARPLFIGPRNAEQMTGVTWRWLRDHAVELGVEILRIDGKSLILADRLLAAIEARAATTAEGRDEHGTENAGACESDVDELAAMRARVAKAGGRRR